MVRNSSVVIDVNGHLLIERKGVHKKQRCKYHDNKPCGDICPFFGNPEEFLYKDDSKVIEIELCDDYIMQIKPEKFTDKRS